MNLVLQSGCKDKLASFLITLSWKCTPMQHYHNKLNLTANYVNTPIFNRAILLTSLGTREYSHVFSYAQIKLYIEMQLD